MAHYAVARRLHRRWPAAFTRGQRSVPGAGVDAIEHATFMTADGVDVPQAVIRAIASQRIAVGTTVGCDPARPGHVMPQIASRMPRLIATRRRLHESGAILVPGSDAGVTPAKPHDVLVYAGGRPVLPPCSLE